MTFENPASMTPRSPRLEGRAVHQDIASFSSSCSAILVQSRATISQVFARCLSFARLQMMQSDFRATIKSYGNDRRTRSDRRVPNHVTIFPSTRAHVSRKNRSKSDGGSSWKANLTTVGMPAQHQVELGISSLPINFRRVRKKNRELATRYPRCSFFRLSAR